MENNIDIKRKKLIKFVGITSIVWGILYFLFRMFYPTSVFDLYGGESFSFTLEKIEQIRNALQFVATFINIFFIVILLIINICCIIFCKDNKIKLFSGNYLWILFSSILHILGLVGLSFIIMIITGILILINKNQNKI